MKNIDIVDAQAHIGPGAIGETLAAMNALGIRGLVIDEYWLKNPMAFEPNEKLAGEISRPICPTAEEAARKYPGRFAWMLRINRLDPEYRAQIRKVRDAKGGKAVRLIPGMDPREVNAFVLGGYDDILRDIAQSGLPLSLLLPDLPEEIKKCARKFPDLRIVVDHCGLFSNAMRAMNPAAKPLNHDEQLALYDRVLSLSDLPNVYLKWAHYSTMFGFSAYPGDELHPILRKTIGAFGAERILWASDFSVNQSGDTWGELLYSILGDRDLTENERRAILGGNAAKLLGWNDVPE